jgi:hypothetical protein
MEKPNDRSGTKAAVPQRKPIAQGRVDLLVPAKDYVAEGTAPEIHMVHQETGGESE